MKALMKSKIKLLFSLIILFAALTGFVFTSCENSIQNNQAVEETGGESSAGQAASSENPESGLIKIVVDNFQNDARTVLPDIDTANIVSLSLSGTQGSNTKSLGSWTSVPAMISDTIELKTGAWSLTLTALLNNGVTFTATTPATITGTGTQTVNFSLSTTATQGGVYLKVSYTGTAQAATYQLYQWTSGVQGASINSGDLTLNTTNHEVVYERPATGSTALAEGNYRIIINFWGDENKTVFLNSYSEIIRIKGGFTSYADDRTIELNSMYTITYMNGGLTPATLAGNPASSLVEKYSARSTAITLPAMVREGYVFDGWFTNSACTGTPLSTFEITSSTTLEPKTFYAKYRKICYLTYIISSGEDAEINLDDLTPAQKTTYGIPNLPENHTEGETTDLPVLSFTDGESTPHTVPFDGYHYGNLTAAGPALTGTGASQKYVIGANDLSDNTTIYIKVNPINSYVDPNAESDTVLAFNVSTPAKTVSAAKGWLKGAASTNNPKLYVKGPVKTAADVEALSSLTSTAYGNAIVMRHSSLTDGNVVNFVSGTASLQNVTIDGGANWGANHAADYVNESSNTGITATAGILSVGRYATLNMTNVTLQNNHNSKSSGKTITIVGSASMNSCTVTDCKAAEGGGIYVTDNLSIEDSTISYNYGTSEGGGLKALTVTPVSVKGTTFIGNKSADGGAIYNEGGLILEDCTFTSNIVTGNGRNIYHLGDLQFKGEITFNDKTSNDIYYDNSETDTNPITFSSFTATGTGLPQTITAANYYSGPESAKVYNRQVFDFSTFSTNTTLINTILGYFELRNADYVIDNSGIIKPIPGTINVTPGFPGNYVCKWSQTVSGSSRTINITVKDLSGASIWPGTTAPAILSDSIEVGIYEGADYVKTENTLSFTYPTYLDPPSGTPFYVKFNIKVDDTTAYSYDYWPEGGVTYVGTGLIQAPQSTFDGSSAVTNSSVFISGRNIGTIKSLIASDHEVTQGEYTTYCKYGVAQPSGTYGEGPNYPAYNVNWYDAIIYCNLKTINDPELGLEHCVYSLGGDKDPRNWDYDGRDTSDGKYCGPSTNNAEWNGITFDQNADGWRLPTEIEWEYLARGGKLSGTQTIYSGSNTVDDVAWYSTNSSSKTHEVKGLASNDLGLYDMSGNVWEWCWDRYDSNIGSDTSATGPTSGTNRVYRGGGWYDGATDVSRRYASGPNNPNVTVGFRVVRSSD